MQGVLVFEFEGAGKVNLGHFLEAQMQSALLDLILVDLIEPVIEEICVHLELLFYHPLEILLKIFQVRHIAENSQETILEAVSLGIEETRAPKDVCRVNDPPFDI